jgi:aspartyl-tRNA(Asn)/glutamyl-tRNA(Gln) amidotransferase subunit A
MTELRDLSAALGRGEIRSTDLVRKALARAKKSDSVFVQLNEDLAQVAEQVDLARDNGESLPALAGIPITLKDLFNVKNDKTLSGSIVLKRVAKPESMDAEVVAPLREAGLLFLGRTNMSEFAFSGLGKNHHYGTPLSIWDRQTGRVPGGSSSGSAVSVAEDIVVATLGSDTAGSCRIPAAFNSIVGVKPSYGRMSLKGIFPLSPTSDAPGPLARDVDSCFILDQLMSGEMDPAEPLPSLAVRDLASIRLVVPESEVFDDLDVEVISSFEQAVERLEDSGVKISRVKMPVIDDCIDLFFNQAIVIYEIYHHLSELLDKYGDEFDPLVRQRVLAGSEVSEIEQQQRYRAKASVVERFNREYRQLGADALIYPTTACIPPALSETEEPAKAIEINLRCLRNTSTVNNFDGCSISLPCQPPGEAPVGLMISSMHGDDLNLYSVAATIEQVVNRNLVI